MAYECVCFKCNKSFFAVSKRAGICPNCKTPEQARFDRNEHKMIDRVTGQPKGFPPEDLE